MQYNKFIVCRILEFITKIEANNAEIRTVKGKMAYATRCTVKELELYLQKMQGIYFSSHFDGEEIVFENVNVDTYITCELLKAAREKVWFGDPDAVGLRMERPKTLNSLPSCWSD